MSLSLALRQPATRCIFSQSGFVGVSSMQSCRLDVAAIMLGRFASNSSKASDSGRGSRKILEKQKPTSVQEKRQLSAARKASILLSQIKKAGRGKPQGEASAPPEKIIPSVEAKHTPEDTKNKDKGSDKVPQTRIISEKEAAIQRRIVSRQGKILGPGIWTFFALTGTFGTLAFVDAMTRSDSSSGTGEPIERTQLPQTWYLTPTVIIEGFKAGWRDLDYLTIGIIVTTVGIHFLKKAPFPLWGELIHITGERKHTAFTYHFVHTDWEHLIQNMFGLCWFLPGVVRALDSDLPQAAAIYLGAPLITSFLQHFTFRWGWIKGIPLNLGASGAISAIFGAFCMLYPDEKVWTPAFVILRLDAKYWGMLFTVWQVAAMIKPPSAGARPAHTAHVISLGLGAAYVYFDAQEKVWKPLVSLVAKGYDRIVHGSGDSDSAKA